MHEGRLLKDAIDTVNMQLSQWDIGDFIERSYYFEGETLFPTVFYPIKNGQSVSWVTSVVCRIERIKYGRYISRKEYTVPSLLLRNMADNTVTEAIHLEFESKRMPGGYIFDRSIECPRIDGFVYTKSKRFRVESGYDYIIDGAHCAYHKMDNIHVLAALMAVKEDRDRKAKQKEREQREAIQRVEDNKRANSEIEFLLGDLDK